MSRGTILVTGGAGYIGSHTVLALRARGEPVVVLDNLYSGFRQAVLDTPLVVGSVGDRELVARVLREHKVDTVMHFAAHTVVPESVSNPLKYYGNNTCNTRTLLEACSEAGVRNFVFSSTAAVYGAPDESPIPEDAPLRPINPYGETKRTLETALEWYGRAHGLRSVTLRYFNVAGATNALGEDHDPETHLIPNVLASAEGGPALTVFGDDYPTPDGTCVRDYIHVADLADAHLLALEATTPGDRRTDTPLVCNLGNGGGFSIREVLDATARLVGHEVPHAMGPRRAGDPPVLVATADRARDMLRWQPRRPSLDEIIGSALEWRRTHPRGYRA